MQLQCSLTLPMMLHDQPHTQHVQVAMYECSGGARLCGMSQSGGGAQRAPDAFKAQTPKPCARVPGRPRSSGSAAGWAPTPPAAPGTPAPAPRGPPAEHAQSQTSAAAPQARCSPHTNEEDLCTGTVVHPRQGSRAPGHTLLPVSGVSLGKRSLYSGRTRGAGGRHSPAGTSEPCVPHGHNVSVPAPVCSYGRSCGWMLSFAGSRASSW
jgi:hypothetical protein